MCHWERLTDARKLSMVEVRKVFECESCSKTFVKINAMLVIDYKFWKMHFVEIVGAPTKLLSGFRGGDRRRFPRTTVRSRGFAARINDSIRSFSRISIQFVSMYDSNGRRADRGVF
jgi:hypothetical protein